MSNKWYRLLNTLQLMRVTLVFSAMSNVWLIVFLTHAPAVEGTESAIRSGIVGSPLWWDLALSSGVAIGMYFFGVILNDVLDARQDKLYSPNRPIASGAIRPTNAVVLAFLALMFSMLCAVGLGQLSAILCLICASGALFYNGLAKSLPAVGIITMGLVRGAHMMIPDPKFTFIWPVWFAMTHVILVAAVCYRLERKRPRLIGWEVWGVTAGLVFWSIVLVGWMAFRDSLIVYGRPWIWGGPLVAAIVFMVVARKVAATARVSRVSGRKLKQLGLMWLILYDALWLFGAGLWWQASLLGGLLVLSIALTMIGEHVEDLATHGKLGFQIDRRSKHARSPQFY